MFLESLPPKDGTQHVFTMPMVCKDGTPALRCRNCGFVWKANMNRPRSTCEDIKKK